MDCMQGLEDAECGVFTSTEYSGEDVNVLAGQIESDGSGFLLWERNASYMVDERQHFEDVCGCSYIQMDKGEATIIATFRQPTPVCTSTVLSRGMSSPGISLVVLHEDPYRRGSSWVRGRY